MKSMIRTVATDKELIREVYSVWLQTMLPECVHASLFVQTTTDFVQGTQVYMSVFHDDRSAFASSRELRPKLSMSSSLSMESQIFLSNAIIRRPSRRS